MKSSARIRWRRRQSLDLGPGVSSLRRLCLWLVRRLGFVSESRRDHCMAARDAQRVQVLRRSDVFVLAQRSGHQGAVGFPMDSPTEALRFSRSEGDLALQHVQGCLDGFPKNDVLSPIHFPASLLRTATTVPPDAVSVSVGIPSTTTVMD
jgi:hypothetical protein